MSDSSLFLVFTSGFIAGSAVTLFASVVSFRSDTGTSPFRIGSTPSTKTQLKRVSIDESTFVTKVDDDSLQSSGVTLGTVTTSQDDINAASSKLLQLKKTKG